MATPRIILDRPDYAYELRWCDRAAARLSSLDRPPLFKDLGSSRKGFYALCAFIWAAITDRNHRFIEPEDLAQYLSTDAQQSAAVAAINAMLVEAFPPDEDVKKKTGPTNSTPATPGT
jgi:hypothetical protein